MAWSNSTRADGFKLRKQRFRLDGRKKFFTMRPWPRLPREAVAAPSLEGFKVGWGLEHPGLVKGVPAHGRGFGTE